VKRCPGCGDEFRAFILLPTGELERKLVCSDCAGVVAVRIVPCTGLRAVAQCDQCTAPARFCDAHRKRPTELDPLARKLRSHITAAELGLNPPGPACTCFEAHPKPHAPDCARSGLRSDPVAEEYQRGRVSGLETALELVRCLIEGRPL
jgi:hypothetical protein